MADDNINPSTPLLNNHNHTNNDTKPHNLNPQPSHQQPTTTTPQNNLPFTLSLLVLALPTLAFFLHETTFSPNLPSPLPPRPSLHTLLLSYTFTGTLGLALVILVQATFGYLLTLALFGGSATSNPSIAELTKTETDVLHADAETIARRRAMARSWRYVVYMVLFAFLLAGFMEESVKYLAVVVAMRFGRVETERDVVVVAVSAAMGFMTVECLGFVGAAWWVNGERGKRFALTVAERVVLGPLVHGMLGALVGVGVVVFGTGEFGRVVWLPALLHGGFDFMVLSACAVDGNVGWVHPRRGWPLWGLMVGVLVFVVGLGGLTSVKMREVGVAF